MTPETGQRDAGDRYERDASTEPGPDDPGDHAVSATTPGAVVKLQRSRGRMTPETIRSGRTTRTIWPSCFNGAGAG